MSFTTVGLFYYSRSLLLLGGRERPLEGVDHDHGDDAGEEENNGEGVEDRKPVHLLFCQS